MGFSHCSQQVIDAELVYLFVEFDRHCCLLGVHEDVHDLGTSYSFSLFKKLAAVHFVKENISRKHYVLLGVSCSSGNDIFAVYYVLDSVVVDLGEPVSNLYAVLVPTCLFLLSLDWQVDSARLFANNVFHVFENYMFDGSVVDLSVIEALWRVQVQNTRPSKVIVALKQSTDHLLALTTDEVLGHLSQSVWVLQIVEFDASELGQDFVLIGFLPELYLENGIATTLDQFGQLGHRALYFLVEVVCTLHVSDHKQFAHFPELAA